MRVAPSSAVRVAGGGRRRRAQVGTVAKHAILSLIGVVCVLPFVYSVLASFKSPSEIVAIPPSLLPREWTLDSYRELFRDQPMAMYFSNSLTFSILSTLAAVISSAAAAYVFAKYRFRGKNALFMALLATVMVPFGAVLVPLYLLIAEFGWLNTYHGVIVPTMFTTFGIFLVRQFVAAVPDETIEAARIDGASEGRIFATIIVPLIGPALGVLAILHFLAQWDSFLWPLTVISETELKNLPMAIASLAAERGPRYDLQITASVLANLPVLLVFAFASRRITDSVMLTGGK